MKMLIFGCVRVNHHTYFMNFDVISFPLFRLDVDNVEVLHALLLYAQCLV